MDVTDVTVFATVISFSSGILMLPIANIVFAETTVRTSDATLVFSRPASPDDRILKEIIIEIARKL